ncbi:MAG TPA: UDP-N-acetylglucosamine-1-phosphate transferase [Nitrososphaerales archaeon]|nr:UDP-N-acetylglucosamine-1-phosphate transferase [Nitrososphaerales archaeon]
MLQVSLQTLVNGFLAFIFPLVTIIIFTPMLIKILSKRGSLVEDYHKPDRPLIPQPGGPVIFIALVLGESIVYVITGANGALALIFVTAIAGIIGILDDIYTLGGVLKPTLLIIASFPILILGTYNFHIEFPIFGDVRLSIIYPILVLLAIPVTANTVNTIDVLNGAVTGFIAISSIPLIFALVLKGSIDTALMVLPLLSVTLGFFIFHKFPSKIFPGDSGSLSLGALYGAIAIVGGIEIIGVVALLPAILNSFFFLSSVKRLVEGKTIKKRPVNVLSGNRLEASKNGSAPITLVRLILADGPLLEKEIVQNILILTAFSSFLAIITAILTWVI